MSTEPAALAPTVPALPAGPGRRWPAPAAFVLAVAAYVIVGVLALQLAIPPAFSVPLYPPAGIALVAVLLGGPRFAAVGAIGAFIVNWTLADPRQNTGFASWGVPLVVALGAGAQAWLGGWLIGRFVRRPLVLDEPRDIALFLALGGPVACLLSAAIGHAALAAAGTVPSGELAVSLLTWWAGDTLGVLIGAPVLLTLVGRPRDAWAPRRTTVGLPLAAVTGLLAIGIAQVAGDDASRLAGRFERDAAAAAARVDAALRDPLHALEAIHGVFIASDEVTPGELDRAARAWLAPAGLLAIGWSERVPRAELAAWEASVRAAGDPGFRVFERADAQVHPEDEAVVAIRHITPPEPNRGALGVNALSLPAPREAILAAAASGRPAATAPMRLTQSAADAPATGVVIYQPVYRTPEPAPERRLEQLRGVVFVTLRVDEAFARLRGELPAYLELCLVDTPTQQRLAGPEGCAARPSAELVQRSALELAGRRWTLVATASPAAVPDATRGNAWRFASVGLLAAAMLGTLLLVVTGRTRRIESAVRERTAALQAEVHERERAQAALRESEKRFRNILNTVPIGIIYSDVEGRVRQTNPRFRELTGYTEAELQAMPADAWTHPEDTAADATAIAALLDGSLPMARREKRIVAKDGRTLWVQATTTVLRDAQGRPRRIVGVVEDISDHLRLQEAEHAREAAEAANRAKSEFLSRMSHELRTPLNAMLGFAQLLELDQKQPLAPSQKPWVGQIQQAGWHLLEMINDVLDLSRIESGNLRLQSEQVSTAQVIAESVALVEADAARRGVRIEVEVEPAAATLRGDTTRVKQILTNLLSNAVKYNVDGGRVEVHARAAGDEGAELSVADSGIGMTDEQLASLFQPFNRLGRERSSAPGTGIGLVISKRLAELMGGSLDASSTPGAGTAFRLVLPRIAEPDTVAGALRPADPGEAGYHQRVVHYVEDNETNVEVMRGVLAQRPQVRLDVSLTGLDGLARIRTQPPDLILLDMHLPDIPGIELLRHLKADPATAGIPVVVVSADALAGQIDAALAAGAMRYLTKPVGVAELLDVVDGVLDSVETHYG